MEPPAVPTFEEFLEARQGPITKCSSLSDHDLDLWEHGSLLFSAFEFEAAAELFVELSRSIPDDELYSTLCLLNAAIIYARLGDFSKASQHLSEIEEVEELLPITLCLIGHVEYELGRFDKSQDCFKIALQAIDEDQPYDHLGLKYSLREEQIQQNLDFLGKGSELGMVGTIPADVLFEAPPREGTSIHTDDHDERRSIHSAASSRSLSASHTITPLQPGRPFYDTDFVERSLHQGSADSSGLHATSSVSSIVPKPLSKPPRSTPTRKARFAARYIELRSEGKRVLTKKFSAKSMPKEAVLIEPQVPLEIETPVEKFIRPQARDARTGAERTGHLKHFIKQLVQKKEVVARDARGRPGSISNLAQFFRGDDSTHARAPVVSQTSVGSASQAETGASKSSSHFDAMPTTTPSSMASTQHAQVQRQSMAKPSPLESRDNKLERSNSRLSRKAMLKRRTSATSDPSRRSREQNGSGSLKAVRSRSRPPLQAVHPALRSGFSLDHQEG